MSFTTLFAVLALGQAPVEAPAANSPTPATSEALPTETLDPPPDRGLLMSLFDRTPAGDWLDRRRISVGGWTALSFTPSSAQRDHGPMGFNSRANEFLLQQNWLRIDRAIDSNSTSASFGFRSDWILPGSDYRYNIARGLWDSQLTARGGEANRYGIDPAQFYAEALLPNLGDGLNLKLGRFLAPYGVENVAAVDTPLASRSYTFIYNPFTQTGLLGTLKWNANWSIKSGVVMGNDVFISPAASPYFVGGFRFAPENGNLTADFTAIVGSGRYDQSEQFHNPQIFDLVLTRKLGDKTTWSLEGLYGFTRDVPGIGFANWFGVVNYLTHQWTDQLASTARLEFFNDVQGQRTGFSGLYTAITTGVTYKPRPWLWLRPELRFDHSDSRPFEGKPNLFTAGLEAIWKW